MADPGEQSHPSAPVSQESPDHIRQIPIEVRTSFWIWVVGALLNVLPIVAMLKNWRARANEIRLDNPALTPTEADEQAWTAVWISAGFYALIALLFILCAMRMRAGRRWARILLPILALLNIAPVVVSVASSMGWLGTAAAVTATVLMFVTPANAYFRAHRRT